MDSNLPDGSRARHLHPLTPLRHYQVATGANPTGEQLLDRLIPPYRIWVPSEKSVVLGNSQDPAKELRVEAVQRDGVPVHKRLSGGGAVLLSPGCLCVGLRFAKRKHLSIHDYFAKAAALIIGIVKAEMGLELMMRGTSDLACIGQSIPSREPGPTGGFPERKVAGCALYMPRDFVLYLASILVDPDFQDIEKYLAHPSKEPDYRSGRKHSDFLAGLSWLAPKPVGSVEMIPWFEKKIPVEPGLDLDWEQVAGFRPG